MTTGDGSRRRGRPPSPTLTSVAIYEQLKRDILRFEFQPGDRLVELTLCERYGVSRTPVREALRRLEHDRLVVALNAGGRIVRGLDITDYEDVYTVRRVLEVHTVAELARRGDRIDLEALRDDWRDGYSPETTPLDGSYVVPDERFHLNLARATGNAYLVESMQRVHDRLRAIRSVDFTVRERLLASAAQHMAIIEAICARDAPLAVTRTEAHIQQSKDEIRTAIVRILSGKGVSRQLHLPA